MKKKQRALTLVYCSRGLFLEEENLGVCCKKEVLFIFKS